MASLQVVRHNHECSALQMDTYAKMSWHVQKWFKTVVASTKYSIPDNVQGDVLNIVNNMVLYLNDMRWVRELAPVSASAVGVEYLQIEVTGNEELLVPNYNPLGVVFDVLPGFGNKAMNSCKRNDSVKLTSDREVEALMNRVHLVECSLQPRK
ncbi:hypothetical protein P43SY_011062 [Pythium insidiosum]|uniref:Uncharacterized protein n=1 Tax=Pythium insidiosum TaxID=114742 RepID=A0AAD5L767_PYTIN|nr:hypothetical protein P43SY_011062 [Pythium insidiosum]